MRPLLLVVIGIPLLAGLLELLTSPTMSERHHTHHDTYTVSKVVTRTLLLVMVFMAVLGSLTVWLCHLGVFRADPELPLAFFVSFQSALLVMYVAISRCQTMTYGDHMVVRPSFGRTRTVAYRDIERIERRQAIIAPNFQDLYIRLRDGRSVRVSGLLDTEQMLLRIDRFDALVG